MLVAVAGLAFNSIRMLLEMCDYTGNSSYEAIGQAAFGLGGKILTVLNIFVHTMGGTNRHFRLLTFVVVFVGLRLNKTLGGRTVRVIVRSIIKTID